MIIKGNFSGDPVELFKGGKSQFMKSLKGRYNGDLETLWQEVEQKAKEANLTKKTSRK